MKRLSLKEAKKMLNDNSNYCVRINEFTRQVHLVMVDFGCSDYIIGYLTFNQFIKLDFVFGLVPVHIYSLMFDYYTIRKEK